MIKNSGFKPNIFDTDPIAISNNYQFNYELPEEGTDVILNIGNSTTNVVVWGKIVLSSLEILIFLVIISQLK